MEKVCRRLSKCPDHPNYKGIRKSKRDCKICDLIFKSNQEQANKKGTFPSLTTPGKRYYLNHILAEISCIMLFGKLPPMFWTKDSPCSNKVKSHYKKILMGCKSWQAKTYTQPVYGCHPLDNIKRSLNYLVLRYEKENVARKNYTKKIITKQEEKSKIDTNFFEASKTKKKNLYESLNEISEE